MKIKDLLIVLNNNIVLEIEDITNNFKIVCNMNNINKGIVDRVIISIILQKNKLKIRI